MTQDYELGHTEKLDDDVVIQGAETRGRRVGPDRGEMVNVKFTVGKNPKTAVGRTKPALLSVIPPAGLLHLGQVMKLGATKYGPFNWRTEPVPAEVYVDAAMRHLMSWFDGESIDSESGCSHLAHVMACCAIIIDAQENGMLDDNRPIPGRVAEMIANFQETGEFNKGAN